MEERVPPLPPPSPPPPDHDHPNNNKSHDSKLQLRDISPNTYVVQVPKDQIYHVPTPENARIAVLHRNSPPREKRQKGCCCLVLIIVIIIITTIIFTGGVLGGLFSIVLTLKSPRFSIQRFHLVTKPHPQYDVALQVYNPNSKVGILYKEQGHVSLSLRRQQVASGAYPSFYQPHNNSTAFGVALRGSTTHLPKEVDESVVNERKKVHVTFSLAICVQARIKMGLLRSGTMTYDVMCQVTVDTLVKETRLVSQQCETK